MYAAYASSYALQLQATRLNPSIHHQIEAAYLEIAPAHRCARLYLRQEAPGREEVSVFVLLY